MTGETIFGLRSSRNAGRELSPVLATCQGQLEETARCLGQPVRTAGKEIHFPHRLQTQAWIPASRTRTPSLSNSCAILRGRSRPPHSEHGFFVSSIIASVHASRV